MPRQANGAYVPPANTAAVSGASISSVAFNTLETDIGTEITNSLDRGGRSAMTAALPMGGQKITGAADPTVSTDVATKNYVDTATTGLFSTGDVKLTLKIVPDTGWLMFDDGTFGSSSSGSSNSNNIANLALFSLLFNSPFTDANIPMFTSGGAGTTRAAQVSASAAWAANCRMSLPKALGRVLGIAGAGAGLTTRVLGSVAGAETSVIGQTNLPNVSFTNSGISITSAGSVIMQGFTGAFTGGTAAPLLSNAIPNTASSQNWFSNTAFTVAQGSAASGGSGTGLPIIQPTSFLNIMIKI